MKKCNNCGEIKPLIEFYRKHTVKDGRMAICILCFKAKNKEKYLPIKLENKKKRELAINKRKLLKICSGCKIEKDTSEFHRNKSNLDGFNCYCKECVSKKPKKYNPASRRESYLRNKQKSAERDLKYVKERRKRDPEFKLRIILKSTFSTSIRKKGVLKNKSFSEYTGYEIEEYYSYLQSDPLWEEHFILGVCHIDHIIPQCKYDFTDPEEIKKCWNPRNLRLLPKKENMKKHSRVDFELIKKYGIEDLLPKSLF